MRWVVAQPGPSFSVQDVYAGWVEALREVGETVIEFNLGDRLTFYGGAVFPETEGGEPRPLDADMAVQLAVNGLYSTLYKARPDVLLVVSGFYLEPEVYLMCRQYGTRIVVVHTESPYEDQRQIGLAAYADVNLINDPTNLAQFRNVAPTWYIPHAYRPSVHKPGEPVDDLRCDFTFNGTGYPSRIEFFERMDFSGLDVMLTGNWQAAENSPLRKYVPHDLDECLDNDQVVATYHSAQVSMNLYRREAERPDLAKGWAMGPREVELAACGLFYLRDPRGEGDEVLSMLPTFTSPEEASDLLRWWLNHPQQRVQAAARAREAVADRTFTNHAVGLLRLLREGVSNG